MSVKITNWDDVPIKSYYFICDDTFLSGWGEAKWKKAVYITPLETWEELWQMYAYACTRADVGEVYFVNKDFNLARSAKKLFRCPCVFLLTEEDFGWKKKCNDVRIEDIEDYFPEEKNPRYRKGLNGVLFWKRLKEKK